MHLLLWLENQGIPISGAKQGDGMRISVTTPAISRTDGQAKGQRFAGHLYGVRANEEPNPAAC